jgi:hypothetical protein
MTKKPKQSKKATKSSKRTKVAAKPEDEMDTAAISTPQATPATPEVEIAVESQQSVAVAAPATPATLSKSGTRSDAAKANIKEGLRLHQIAGRPTKAQLLLVFGKAGYLLTWLKRTEKIRHDPRNISGRVGKGCCGCATHPCRQAECGEDKRDSVKPFFSLGRVVATPGALAAMGISGDDISTYLARHQSGDWGDVDALITGEKTIRRLNRDCGLCL